MKTAVVIFLTVCILFIIIYFFVYLFIGNGKVSLLSEKPDEKRIIEELKTYYHEGDFGLVSNQVENILNSEKVSKKFRKDLILIKLRMMEINRDYIDSLSYLEDNKKYLEKKEYLYLKGYFTYRTGQITKAEEILKDMVGFKVKTVNEQLKIDQITLNLSDTEDIDAVLLLYKIFLYSGNPFHSVLLLQAMQKSKNYEKITEKYNNGNYFYSSLESMNSDIKDTVNYNTAYALYMNGKYTDALNYLINIHKPMDGLDANAAHHLLTAKIFFRFEKYEESEIELKNSIDYGIDEYTLYYNYINTKVYSNSFQYKNLPQSVIIDNLEIPKDSFSKREIISVFLLLLYFHGFDEKVVSAYNAYWNLSNDQTDDQLYNNRDFYIDMAYLQSFFRLNFNRIKAGDNEKEKFLEIAGNISTKKLVLDKLKQFSLVYINQLLQLGMISTMNEYVESHIAGLKEFKEIIKTLVYSNLLSENYDKALLYLNTYFNRSDDPFEYYYFYSLIEYFEENDPQKALDTVNNAEYIPMSPDKQDFYRFYKAQLYYQLKQFDNSFAEMQKIVEKDRDMIIFELMVSLKQKKYETAIEIGNKLLLTDKKNYLISFYVGLAYYFTGKYQDCLMYFSNSIEQASDNNLKSDICIYLGNAYYYLGSSENFYFYYQQAVFYNPVNSCVKINLDKVNSKNKGE